MMETNIKYTKTGAYTYNDEFYNFEFKTNLTASEKVTFVNSVTNTIVGEGYNSIVKDIMFDHMIVQLFTDIGNFYIQNVEDKIDAIEQFLNETNIVDIVKANMEVGLLDELNDAIELDIEYRTGIHPNPLNKALASLLSTLEKKINEVDLESMMGMASKLAGMTDDFNIDNLVKAYMNSDVHKANLEEIAASKEENPNVINMAEMAEKLDKAIKETNEEAKVKSKSSKSKSNK